MFANISINTFQVDQKHTVYLVIFDPNFMHAMRSLNQSANVYK